jgi:hypothetical protein
MMMMMMKHPNLMFAQGCEPWPLVFTQGKAVI